MRRFSLLIATLVILQGTGECDEAPEPPEIELAVVGTLGECPAGEGAIRIQVDGHGRILAGGQCPLSLDQLGDEVEKQAGAEGWTEEDGSSHKVLVLEADQALPWAVTVWIVKAALNVRHSPREIYFAARAEKDGAKGAIGWCLPRTGQTPSLEVPWTAAVLRLHGGEADDPELLLPILRDAQARTPEDGETRLDILAPRSGDPGVPTGYVLRLFDLALRAGVTDVCFEGRGTPLYSDYTSVDWLLKKTAEYRREGQAPQIRVFGQTVDRSLPAVESLPAQGVLPHRYGLDVVATEKMPRPRHRGRPDPGRFTEKPCKEALRWLAAQQSERGSWAAEAPKREVAATGIALQAFLHNGYSTRGRHEFAKAISKGLRFLKNRQQDDGRYVPGSDPDALHGHAAATMAMAEAYDITYSPIFRTSLQRALDAISAMRKPIDLWVKEPDSVSIDVWMAFPIATVVATNRDCLQRGQEPKVQLDEQTVAAVREWVSRLSSGEGPMSAGLHGALIRLRVLLGESWSDSPTLREAWERHGRLTPDMESEALDMADVGHGLDAYRRPTTGHNFWTWWGVWRSVGLSLVQDQCRSGSTRGSWDPRGGEEFGGGRVVATALAARVLRPGPVTWGTPHPHWLFGD